MSSIEVHDATLEFDDSGTGNAVVLLHGFPLARSFWHQQVDVLCETHRVIVPDLRGHGDSAVSRGTVSMSDMAADVIAILDACEIDKATICGLSMGGYVAWELWRQYSHRLSALVLCNTRAAADNETVARARHMMAAQVIEVGAELAVESMLPKLMAPQTYENQPETVDFVKQLILATDPHAIAATQRGMAERRDMIPLLADIDVPALVISGVHDGISPVEEMAAFASAMPNASHVSIEDAGHLSPLEQPAAVNDAISHFLANV